MRCEIAETAQAASALLVALARQPLMHQPVFDGEKDILGCLFALHDRSDDVSDRQAVVQADVCLCLSLLAESPALPAVAKERLLRQEGGARCEGALNLLEHYPHKTSSASRSMC